jgi:hypothetical protein
MKVRVWAYRDGTLLPDGFECEVPPEPSPPRPEPSHRVKAAALNAVVQLAESCGLRIHIGTDKPGNQTNARAWPWWARR